MSYTGQLAQLM